MKKIVFILTALILTSCFDDDDTPIADKLNDTYEVDSLSGWFAINDTTYTAKDFTIIQTTDFTQYYINYDSIQSFGISFQDTITSVEEITSDTVNRICLKTPTTLGTSLTTCNSDVTDFTYNILNDSTIEISFDSATVIIPESIKQFLPDSIYYISTDITLYTSLK